MKIEVPKIHRYYSTFFKKKKRVGRRYLAGEMPNNFRLLHTTHYSIFTILHPSSNATTISGQRLLWPISKTKYSTILGRCPLVLYIRKGTFILNPHGRCRVVAGVEPMFSVGSEPRGWSSKSERKEKLNYLQEYVWWGKKKTTICKRQANLCSLHANTKSHQVHNIIEVNT